MTLSAGCLLQGGKYRIEKVLGQGGFGITYLAKRELFDDYVAIKEFFFKDYCDRTNGTSEITLGTAGNKEIVDRFMLKFIKEAQVISRFDHPNIVRVHDIFKENNTAYYVMAYIDGESAADKVKRQGALPEKEAIDIIKGVCSALSYVHSKKVNHLDVKPANIMIRKDDNQLFLVDFGTAKQYDLVSGNQTSTTPVGISHGYAPIEQYKEGGIREFSPQTDIYAVGATLFKLVTGITPPQVSDLIDEGLPAFPSNVSKETVLAIERAMEISKKKRPQTIEDFVSMLPTVDSIDQSHKDQPVSETISLNVIPESKITSKEEPIHQYIEEKSKEQVVPTEETILIKPFRKTNDTDLEIKVKEDLSFVMKLVKSGSFVMGGTKEQGDDICNNELPAHSVILSNDFYIGEVPVTQALWKAVMGSNPSCYSGNNHPVENVSYSSCETFCKKLSASVGLEFRLPTEAEWEFAARGGIMSSFKKFSGSNNIEDVAWYADNASSTTHDVKNKRPNELGIYDMSGNVWEWCKDNFGHYNEKPVSNPLIIDETTHGVIRGGSHDDLKRTCRVSCRESVSISCCNSTIGFRIVCEPHK